MKKVKFAILTFALTCLFINMTFARNAYHGLYISTKDAISFKINLDSSGNALPYGLCFVGSVVNQELMQSSGIVQIWSDNNNTYDQLLYSSKIKNLVFLGIDAEPSGFYFGITYSIYNGVIRTFNLSLTPTISGKITDSPAYRVSGVYTKC